MPFASLVKKFGFMLQLCQALARAGGFIKITIIQYKPGDSINSRFWETFVEAGKYFWLGSFTLSPAKGISSLQMVRSAADQPFRRKAVNTFLSAEQEATRQGYLKFAAEHIGPHALDLEAHKTCLKEFLQGLGQKGYLGIAVPREYGGQGLSFTFCALFAEACGMYEPGLGLSLANHYALIECIKKYGTETQKSRYLPLLSRGEVVGTLAFSEPTAGTDFKAVSCSVEKKGNDIFLSGKKTWVINGAFAGLALVLSKGLADEALSLFLIDSSESSQECGADAGRLGLRSAYLNDVEFKSQKLSAESKLASSKESTDQIAVFAMDVAKTVLAAAAVGLTQAAANAAVEHARTREQFGTTIGQFQGVQWRLADLGTEMEAARLQVMRAAWSLEGDPEKFATYAPMCKWFATRVARQHSGEALQVMGAAGLMDDCVVGRLYRDAKAMEICLGTSDGQKLQLVEQLEI